METRCRRRLVMLGLFFLLGGCGLAYRLYRIQGVEHLAWAQKAVQQRSDSLALYRQRGAILDCHGQPFTGRDYRTCLAVFPELLTAEERKELTPLLAAHQLRLTGKAPLLVANPGTDLVRLAEARERSGVTFCSVPLRYGRQPLAQHLLGYLDPATGRGLAGLEAVYDRELDSGRMVKLTVLTDALRRPIPGLGFRYQEESTARAGRNLVLTLDLDLQRKVETLLDRAGVVKGAVVLMEVGTGKIRALASRPAFDPYAPEQSRNAPDRPLVNRALQAYPPGELFQLVIAAAALESGKFKPESRFDETKSGYGLLTLSQAFAYAATPVFQEVMAALDQTALLALAEACGLGEGGRLGLPGEGTGRLSGKEEGGVAGLVSGAKGIAVTPLQMAALLQVVAGHGRYYPPAVVEGWQEPDGRMAEAAWEKPAAGRQVLAAPTVAALQKMLAATVLYGRGRPAQIRQGAAGAGGAVLSGPAGEGPVAYSWFAGYAPVQNPRLVGVVFLEEDPGGAEKAALLFAALMERIGSGLGF
ncbi:MAG TPA: penicillin-binding transpeptidase domain-containing protein [Capillibacterium sp.]